MTYKDVVNTISFFDPCLSLTSTILVNVARLLPVILKSNPLASLPSFHFEKVVSALHSFIISWCFSWLQFPDGSFDVIGSGLQGPAFSCVLFDCVREVAWGGGATCHQEEEISLFCWFACQLNIYFLEWGEDS